MVSLREFYVQIAWESASSASVTIAQVRDFLSAINGHGIPSLESKFTKLFTSQW